MMMRQNNEQSQQLNNEQMQRDFEQGQPSSEQAQRYYDPQYNQPYYGQSQEYTVPQGNVRQQKPKKDGIGFGIASLVLGILSVFLFMTCVNYIMAILAIIFGIVQICTRKKKGMAVTGIITAVFAILISSLLWICMLFYMQDGGLDNIYNEYYYNYDTDDYSSWYYDEL